MESSKNLYFWIVIITKEEYILPTTFSKFSLLISFYRKFSLTFTFQAILVVFLVFWGGSMVSLSFILVQHYIFWFNLSFSSTTQWIFGQSLINLCIHAYSSSLCLLSIYYMSATGPDVVSLVVRPTQPLPSRSCNI